MLTALSSGNAPSLTSVNVSRSQRAIAEAPAAVAVTKAPSAAPVVASPSVSSTSTAHLAAVTHPTNAQPHDSTESAATGQSRDGLVSLSKGFLGASGLASAASSTDDVTVSEPETNAEDTTNADETGEQQNAASTELSAEASASQPTSPNRVPLTEQEIQELDELAQRDEEVRAHEQAHAAVGGNLAGQPGLEYQQGPDGKRYAVSGEVQIDISVVEGDPEETMQKMRQVYSAAMAPVEPSAADMRIAADAMRKYNDARQELTDERMAELKTTETDAETETSGQPSLADAANSESDNQAPTYNMGIALVMAKLGPKNDEASNQTASVERLDNLTPPNANLNARERAANGEFYRSSM
ncbi:putative metalloprotease CJM1_0395 family protein [Shewanella sp.]|uniref:putative metalloprotease CJM1_0395 family protein n=1 Tax=Shewanella sp. TaxID=50422 RepID=UPI003A96FD40